MSSCNLNQSVVIYRAEQPPNFVAVSSSVEVFEWSHCWLGATSCNWAVQVPSYQQAALEEYEDSGTTQKEDVKKTPAKTLPSTLSKHCMCTISIFAPSLITASLTVHSLSFTYRLNYLLHFSIASFPGLLCFYLPFANTCERRTSEKQGRPGSIHHVNDVKWMWGGRWGGGGNCQIYALALYRSFGLQTSAWLKLLILTVRKLTFKFSTLLI